MIKDCIKTGIMRKFYKNNLIPIMAALILLILDIYLFIIARSWTPLHYESLIPLIGFSSQNKIYKHIYSISALFLMSVILILYFIFSLNFKLLSQFYIFIIIFFPLFSIFAVSLCYASYKNFRGPAFFMLCISGMLFADKVVFNDIFASSYLHKFFEIAAEGENSRSKNAVYQNFQNEFSDGRGGVLIVFESLGVPRNNYIITQISKDYPDFDFIAAPHEGGATLNAETRYLCGYNGVITDFSSCLPRSLEALAMHGNTLRYFNRDILYRNLGFKEIYGRHELKSLKACSYSYYAICDSSLRKKLVEIAKQTNCKKFLYVLTIDGHWPYLKYSNHPEGLYRDVRYWLDAMRKILKDQPSCKVMIAGDHPPPLAKEFRQNKVLIIRQASRPTPPT